MNVSAIGGEAQRIIDQIPHGAVEKRRIGKDLAFAAAFDVQVSIFGRGLIKAGDLFERCAPVKQRTLDLLLGGFGAGEKKQIIDNSRKALALRRGRFDGGAVFLGTAFASESHLGFTEHVSNWRS